MYNVQYIQESKYASCIYLTPPLIKFDIKDCRHLIRTTKIEAIRKSKLIFKVEGSAWEPVSEY
jgi:hypothetical protein